MDIHYLDYAATAPVCPAALEAARRGMAEEWGNPSASYPLGRAAARLREESRAKVARALGCEAEEVVFTSGGTEGDNWAIRAALALGRRRGRHIVTTAIEHMAVLEPLGALEREGYEVTRLKPDREGRIAPEDVEAALRPDTALVSMMLVNNEVGSLLPVAETGRLLRELGSGALLHVDAVQGFLKVPFTPRGLGADFLTLSGHKIGAPKGVGALYIRKELLGRVEPLLRGGGQERGLRSGTEPTHQLAALAAAVEAWPAEAAEAMRALKDYAADTLGAIPGVEVIARGDAPHILAISLPDFSGRTVVEALGGQGVCVSSGSACHRGRPSHVFQAMPLAERTRYGAVRVSFGPESVREDVDALAALLARICERKSLLF